MFTARFLILFLLLLAIIGAYTPGAREQIHEAWQSMQPGLVQFMDSLYVTVRDLIAGDTRDDQMDGEPSPPGNHFDRIVT